MGSPENTNWLFDYSLMDDISAAVPDGNLSNPAAGFSWPMQPLPRFYSLISFCLFILIFSRDYILGFCPLCLFFNLIWGIWD